MTQSRPQTTRRYSDFASRINIDAFEEAIDFQFIENDGKGNDVGYCPDPWGLHKNGDTTGKFALHRDKRVYNCWVCGGGTLLSLTMALRQIGEDEAIDWLLPFVGEQSDDKFESEIDLLLADERRRDPILPWFNERVLQPYIEALPEQREWLEDRRIPFEVAHAHKLGYDAASKKIHKKGTFEGPGIIFPHFWQDRLVGWQVRWLTDERPPWVQKYNNTRDMPKKYTIYNYESVYFSEDPIIVVESVPTALFLEGLGFSSVATFGAGVTSEQLRLLRKCQQGVILAPDNDSPGTKFRTSVAEYLEKFIPVKITDPVGVEGSGSDLADVEDSEDVITYIRDATDTGLL